MIKISSYLLRSRCLLSLNLTNNQLGPESGFILSLILRENTKLNILKIAMNRLGDTNSAKIFKALIKNKNLVELDISSNQLESDVIHDI
jgi:Ran GTPase-activating protein (RanGAP) involved in mRNA processing and transport